MTDNRCGCPHPEEEHKYCEAGQFCGHKDCRCVDGTYYGKMADLKSAKAVFESLRPIDQAPLKAKFAAEKIADDISGRSGLGDEWFQIDAGIREDIVSAWAEIILRSCRG